MEGAVQSCFRRVEKKYLLTQRQYEAMISGMRIHMRPDTYGSYTICNLYYDTADDILIRTSLEKPIYKEKLRMRSYGVPGDCDDVFVEIKKKFNGVVYKRRTVMQAAQAVDFVHNGIYPRQSDSQINREIQWFLGSYRPTPKVFIAYDREAYAGLDLPQLRITFDRNLRWRRDRLDLRLGDDGQPVLEENRILMEIKVPDAAPVWLARLLSNLGAYPTSFSKYGTYYQKFARNQGGLQNV